MKKPNALIKKNKKLAKITTIDKRPYAFSKPTTDLSLNALLVMRTYCRAKIEIKATITKAVNKIKAIKIPYQIIMSLTFENLYCPNGV